MDIREEFPLKTDEFSLARPEPKEGILLVLVSENGFRTQQETTPRSSLTTGNRAVPTTEDLGTGPVDKKREDSRNETKPM